MKLQESMREELIRQAFGALEYAYALTLSSRWQQPSLRKSGKIYTGCNIENAALSPGNCAERTAIFKAVSEGEKDFEAICIVNEDAGKHDYCPPCGVPPGHDGNSAILANSGLFWRRMKAIIRRICWQNCCLMDLAWGT